MANPSEDIRRRQAFEEYYKLPYLGIKRNRNSYFLWCIQRLHDDPSSRPLIPTTNKTTIYKWHKEDKWEEKCKIRELEAMDKSAQTFEDLRQEGYNKINLVIPDAIAVLVNLIVPPKGKTVDPNLQFRAATTLLDRAGLGVEKASQNRHVVGAPQTEEIEREQPPMDGTEEELIAFLTRTAREDIDG